MTKDKFVVAFVSDSASGFNAHRRWLQCHKFHISHWLDQNSIKSQFVEIVYDELKIINLANKGILDSIVFIIPRLLDEAKQLQEKIPDVPVSIFVNNFPEDMKITVCSGWLNPDLNKEIRENETKFEILDPGRGLPPSAVAIMHIGFMDLYMLISVITRVA